MAEIDTAAIRAVLAKRDIHSWNVQTMTALADALDEARAERDTLRAERNAALAVGDHLNGHIEIIESKWQRAEAERDALAAQVAAVEALANSMEAGDHATAGCITGAGRALQIRAAEPATGPAVTRRPCPVPRCGSVIADDREVHTC